MYLIRVLSFIGVLRFNVKGKHVPGIRGGGREGVWWLPAGGKRASQGTFSSVYTYFNIHVHFTISLYHLSKQFGFSSRSVTRLPVQSQKQARSLRF